MNPTDPAPVVTYRDIPDFPGYRAGSDGSVWSCRMSLYLMAVHKKNAAESWRKLKQQKGTRYHQITLYQNGKLEVKRVHRLVASAFFGPCPPGKYVCHSDGNVANNAVSNLRYATPKENCADRSRHGNTCVGEGNGNAKLSADDVKAIRSLRAIGSISITVVAKKYGVSKTHIRAILKNQFWKG